MATVVLVHGLWADGSSWNKVTAGLQAKGYDVTAVQLPLSSLSDDVAVVRRELAKHSGPVVLAGHSYGGMVISAASAGAPQVSALVYVAAVAPEQGEAAGEILGRFSPSAGLLAVVNDSEGYASLDRAKFHEVFAADVADAEAEVMAATQGPAAPACLTEPAGPVGWHGTPSWYLLCKQDETVSPEAQAWIADRIGATVVEADASHAVAVSRPEAVIGVIDQAAAAG